MAWTAIVILDDDKDDVGTATAIWNVGEADELVYSDRAKVNQASAAAFVAEAHEALIARGAKAGREVPLATFLEDLLNG